MKPLFQIKICGITTPTDATMVCKAGADAIGINFYSASPRFVGSNRALEIANSVDRFNRTAKIRIRKVGVFVNSTPAEMAAAALGCGLDAVQFHGDEGPENLKTLQHLLIDRLPHCQFIRAVRSDSNAPSRTNELARVQQVVNCWIGVEVHAILLDAAAPDEYGGTGQPIDWDFVPSIESSVPLILAGGLNPDNVAEAMRTARVSAVDVASGVESSPGIKDPEKVAAFIAAAGH